MKNDGSLDLIVILSALSAGVLFVLVGLFLRLVLNLLGFY